MTRRKMFFRMITASLIRRRSRMLVALLAIAVGATILSGLVTIYYDVPRQMGAQFRNYGANMILVPSVESDAFETMRTVDDIMLNIIPNEQLVGVAPYRYETVSIHDQPVIAAGTEMAGARAASPYWHIDGAWPSKSGEILLGGETADLLGLKSGDKLTLVYTPEISDETPENENLSGQENGQENAPENADQSGQESADEADYIPGSELEMEVTGILETGGSEEQYVYLTLKDLQELTGSAGRLDVIELSVSATREQLEHYAERINMDIDMENVTAQLVKRVTQSESTVLTKLQALVFLVTAVVLALIMICVATTMTAVVTERRKEIGLRKALGASDQSIIGEFMGEGLLLGGVGGILGSGLGFAFAQYVSMNVFNGSIQFQPLLLPLTVIVSILVTGCACLLPVRSATDVDPALVLKGE